MIAIPNMSKPKSCDECWALDDKYDYPMCLITQEQRGYNFNTMTRVMDFCPLIEIVTCGECKWWNRDDKRKDGKGWCENVICGLTKLNAFCSYGERRADEGVI